MQSLPKINIETINHKDQRYPTCGDWIVNQFNEDGTPKEVSIRVSKMGDWKYELAVAIHEMVEMFDCIDKDVSQETVDKYDMAFETLRGQHPDIIGHTEPGDMPTAPYHESHQLATLVEKQYVVGNGISWQAYEEIINNLD